MGAVIGWRRPRERIWLEVYSDPTKSARYEVAGTLASRGEITFSVQTPDNVVTRRCV